MTKTTSALGINLQTLQKTVQTHSDIKKKIPHRTVAQNCCNMESDFTALAGGRQILTRLIQLLRPLTPISLELPPETLLSFSGLKPRGAHVKKYYDHEVPPKYRPR